MNIVQCKPDSKYFFEVEGLFKVQWPDFSFGDYSVQLPKPMAVVADNKPFAGIAFTHHPHPLSRKSVIWINALYVLPKFREKGLAKKLVELATQKVMVLGQSQILAYTDIPEFYQAMGWVEIDSSSDSVHKIMAFTIS
ncbi:GNAT family N-acetyltransferase [Vibrio variabilis]|uniref:GNAT family N-acetyltransferase n=1 Tax=Vibrio variabilis TaxID=990271 RepID=UPI000DDA039A|nr:GNAT family N-acetyltransferase [Vibrio variabilis]